jgi:hypothetical protein
MAGNTAATITTASRDICILLPVLLLLLVADFPRQIQDYLKLRLTINTF